MSTATLNTYPTSGYSAWLRFVWKEYRVLRGFWLAVAGFTALGQLLYAMVLAAPGSDVPTALFGAALVAAALYAIGAAATQFSVEHEDETYQFLSGLPSTWAPVFFGKLAMVAATAIVLAVALFLTGWLIARGGWPREEKLGGILATYGFAAVEGFAWGTLFSLLLKRPLVAALLAIVATALGTQMIVSTTVDTTVATMYLDSYVTAMPVRLVFVAALLAIDYLIARRWIGKAIDSPWRARRRINVRLATESGTHIRGEEATTPESWPATFACLLWQTWREARWLLALPLLVASGSWLFTMLMGFLAPVNQESRIAVALSTALVFPALYGALAFYIDQYRRSFQFLADRGISARRVWVARHLASLGFMIFLLSLFALVCIALSTWAGLRIAEDLFFNNQWQWRSSEQLLGQLLTAAHTGYLISGTLLTAPLAAYAVGQCCSMTIRSGLLASFLAILLSMLLMAWVAVLLAWQLSAWLFLLPIAIGLFAATWLRAPAWFEGRNSIRSWIPFSLAVSAPFLLIVLLLPAVRLRQISIWSTSLDPLHWAAVSNLGLGSDTLAEARQTAAMYLEAAEMLEERLENDPLAAWRNEYFGMLPDAYGDMSEDRIPETQRAAYKAAVAESDRLHFERLQTAVEITKRASQRPTYLFEFDFSSATPDPRGWRLYENWQSTNREYQILTELLSSIANLQFSAPEKLSTQSKFDGYLAGLRLCSRIRRGAPTFVFVEQLRYERSLLESVAQWAAAETVSTSQLREALGELEQFFAGIPSPNESLLADHDLIRKVILGEQLPAFMFGPNVTTFKHLAYLANQLPWERKRALRASDVYASALIKKVERVRARSRNNGFRDFDAELLQELRRPTRPDSPLFRDPRLAAAATSYLVSLEYNSRVREYQLLVNIVDAETCRRALRLQIALGMYARDHGRYPDALSMLVPEYLNFLPLDPYAGESFHYEPRGLSLPLVRFGRTQSGRVFAGIPMIWSVGHDDVELFSYDQEVYTDDDDPNAETRQETVYALRSSDEHYRHLGPSDLVFPLPVLEESKQ